MGTFFYKMINDVLFDFEVHFAAPGSALLYFALLCCILLSFAQNYLALLHDALVLCSGAGGGRQLGGEHHPRHGEQAGGVQGSAAR